MNSNGKIHPDTEQESRENLAALYRLYSKFGWTDLNQTHAAARVPGNPNHFFIKPDEARWFFRISSMDCLLLGCVIIDAIRGLPSYVSPYRTKLTWGIVLDTC